MELMRRALPTTSRIRASSAMSTTLAWNTSAISMIRERSSGLAVTTMRASSRDTDSLYFRLLTRITSTSFWHCLSTCSTMLLSPVTTMVMRVMSGRSVWPAEMLSML